MMKFKKAGFSFDVSEITWDLLSWLSRWWPFIFLSPSRYFCYQIDCNHNTVFEAKSLSNGVSHSQRHSRLWYLSHLNSWLVELLFTVRICQLEEKRKRKVFCHSHKFRGGRANLRVETKELHGHKMSWRNFCQAKYQSRLGMQLAAAKMATYFSF